MVRSFDLEFSSDVNHLHCSFVGERGLVRSVPKILLAAVILLGSVQIANAGDSLQTNSVFQPSIDTLTKLFVAALLLESGLSVLFNWRVYLVLLDGRGWKTIIMVGASWLLVKAVHINWLAQLFNAYGGISSESGGLSPEDFSTQILTALILAGGSNGIYNILLKLGYRAPVALDFAQPKPPPDKAWISITVTRDKAIGPIEVRLDRADPVPDPLPLAIVGFIGPGELKAEIWGLFFRNRMRFPQSAGYTVEPGVAYSLQIEAVDANKQAIACEINKTYVFARGAIVDLRTTL